MIRRSRRWPPAIAAGSRQNTRRRRPPAIAAGSRQNTRRRRPPAIAAGSRQNTRRRRPPAIAAGSRQNTRLRRLAERSRLGGPPRHAGEGKRAGTRPTNDTRELLSVRRPAPGIWRRRPTTTRPPPRQGGTRGESGAVGKKRAQKKRGHSPVDTSGHSRMPPQTPTKTAGKKARAPSPSSKKVRAKVTGEHRAGRQIVDGAGRVPRS